MSLTSNACQACKTRNLECDQGQPKCQRCVKARRKCYQPGSVILMENSFASRQKQRPRGPRSRPVEEKDDHQVTLDRNTPSNINDLALDYYLRHHLRSLDNLPSILKGQSDDVERLLPTLSKGSLIYQSLQCMALTVFAQTQGRPDAAIEASIQYQKLLHTARSNMASITPSNFEACLLAIFFMARYEDSVHLHDASYKAQSFTDGLRSLPHHVGAVAVMKYWKDNLSQTHPPSEVVKHMRRGMLRSALMRGQPLPDWMSDGLLFGENGLELGYDSIMIRIVKLRHIFSTFSTVQKEHNRAQNIVQHTAESLEHEARDIDIALQKWVNDFPAQWSVRKHDLSRRPSREFLSSTVYSFADAAVAAVWNRYYAMRMLINNIQLKILQAGFALSDMAVMEKCSKCRFNIEQTGDDLAASIPFILGRVLIAESIPSTDDTGVLSFSVNSYPEPYVAGMVVWPLTIASSVTHLDDRRKFWFRSEVAGVGKLIGSQVFEAAETDQWLEL